MDLDHLDMLLREIDADIAKRTAECAERISSTSHTISEKQFYAVGIASCRDTLSRLKDIRSWTDYV